MSYSAMNPAFYEMGVPSSPFHAGAPGWTEAPWPAWGNNPVRRGPERVAVDGCGCGLAEADAAPAGLTLAASVGITVALAVLLYYALDPKPRRRAR
jgi:hypothetical protein